MRLRLISDRRGACPPARRPRREPSARRVVSKPGQALPPPTGTAALSSGALHTGGVAAASHRAVLGVLRWCSGRLRTRPPDLRPPRGLPARSPSAPRASLGASSRSPARPCRPRGVLQSGGTWCACTWPGPAAAHGHRSRTLRRPPHQWDQALQASRQPPIGRSLVPPGGPPRRCLSLGAPRAPGA